jgi:hypothetical protein
VGKVAEAYEPLRAIRKRAGIEIGDGNYGLKTGMNRNEMFDAILYERQIELAFEGKRFWDLRRWKKVESTLNGVNNSRKGLQIDLKSTAPSNFATIREGLTLDQLYTDYFTVTNASNQLNLKELDTRYVNTLRTGINWKPEYYYFAIPQSAIDNNPSLLQNIGWNNGSFDPTK